MSRVVKNVIVWVLALAVILCIIAGFTFGLSSVSGVASAETISNSVNNGVVRDNLIPFSSASDILNNINNGSRAWRTIDVANLRLTDDGYLTFDALDSVSFFYCDLPQIEYTSLYYFTLTLGCRVNTALTTYNSLYLEFESNGSSGTTFRFDSSDVGNFQIVTISKSFRSNVASKIELQIRASNGVPCFDIAWVKLEVSLGEGTAGFTGYVPYSKGTYDEGYNAGYNAGVTDGTETGYNSGYDEGYNAGVTDGTQSGYDKGYADGYDEGYNNGLADEVYTASQGFKSSGYEYMNSLKAGTSTKFEGVKSIGGLVDGYEDVDIPLNGLYFAASNLVPDNNGGYLPKPADWESLLDGTVYDTTYEIYAKSQYAMTFDNRVQQAQWLIDHPMDNLVLIPTNVVGGSSGSVYPIYFVMNDRSLLERFVSGAGAAYDLGYQGGYNEGYDAGDGAGYNRGYGVGFNDGQVDASSGNYTFLALIGSVLDAPISAFKGLLDFDLLGVNMSSFVLAIMSLCVIIVIIRVVLR